MLSAEGAVSRLEPPRGARPQAGGYIKWAAGCAAEALPAAETAEAEQGQRSVFCEGAATPEAKAGHRNHAAAGGGEGQNREGNKRGMTERAITKRRVRPPRRGRRTNRAFPLVTYVKMR